MVRVGRAFQRHTSSEDLDARALLTGLRDALIVASTHPDRRPILQLCPPQWAVTARGIVTYGNAPLYAVSAQKLRSDEHLASHVGTKSWVDRDSFDEAYEVAATLDQFDDPLEGELPF
jgi:hypothetical protein